MEGLRHTPDEVLRRRPEDERNADATLVVDASGAIRRANPAALALLGYSPAQLVGSSLDLLVPARFREAHRLHLAQYFRNPTVRLLPLGANLVAVCHDGRELTVDISLVPLESPDGPCAAAVLRPHQPEEVERALRERLDFEALITDVTARVVVATPEDIDEALVQALERLRTGIGADRAVFFEYADDWASGMITHVAYGEGVTRLPEMVDVRTLFPWTDRQLQSGQTVSIPDVSALPPEAAADRRNWQQLTTAALLIVPVFPSKGHRHVIVVDSAWKPRTWPLNLEARIRLLGGIMVDALVRNRQAAQLAWAYEELKALKDRLESENLYLRDSAVPPARLEGFVAKSPAMTRVVELVQRVAATDSAVLLLGETGTGKEMLARAIHRLSPRKDRLLVAVNCAALPAPLVESELFGREKGAYTGALARQAGRVELADRSTLFLDEVGELPLELQAKLLRVLETGEFQRLGSPHTLRVDLRLVAATNRDLAAAVRAGTFRKDLYYRLSVFPITIPPLRERPEDIPELTREIATELGEKMGRRVEAIPGAVIERLQRYRWPGNVRELRNLVERALILSGERYLDIPLPVETFDEWITAPPENLTLAESERHHILRTLDATRGRIRGRGGAAERLGINEATLRSRMKKLGIVRPAAGDPR